MITSEKIKRRLWEGANELRGSMDASRYKDYMLGLMFYKFLSDKTLEKYKDLTRSKEQGSKLVQEYKEASLKYKSLYKTIQTHLGYYVASEYLYQTWIEDINNGTFEVQKVTDSLNSFERTISQEETCRVRSVDVKSTEVNTEKGLKTRRFRELGVRFSSALLDNK